jgi:ParB/RepB/Spo0J family partition protein
MKKQLPDGAQPVPNSLDALIKARLTGGLDPKTSSATTPSLVATTSVGELRLIDPNDIVVTGDRYRRFVEVDDLINSLRENGQIVPILVRPDLTLVNGLRRLSACKALEVNVLAHVVEVANPDAAQIEEDRCREDLLPSEVYRVTESIRPRLADEAWARKVLGKAADKAIKKGRVDDLLADHVGISRGTLKKIREMYQGFEDSPDTFAEVIEAMERDRRIDKHYKAFKALSVPRYEGPMLNSAAISPDWQEVAKVNAAHLLSAVQKLGLPATNLVISLVEALPRAA